MPPVVGVTVVPLMVHAVASLAAQVSVIGAPGAMEEWSTVKLVITTSPATAGGVTLTTTAAIAGPSSPWQVSVYAVVVAGLTLWLPVGIDTTALPVESTQLAALATDHDSVVELPLAMVESAAEKLAICGRVLGPRRHSKLAAAVTVIATVAVGAAADENEGGIGGECRRCRRACGRDTSERVDLTRACALARPRERSCRRLQSRSPAPR